MNKIVYVIIIMVLITIGLFIKRPITGSKINDQALASFTKIIESNKQNKTYHMDLNHFGYKLNNTEKFEWTKNMITNDLDIALVMNAKDFEKVGINVEKMKAPFIYKKDDMDELLIYAINISDNNKISYGAIDGMRRVLSQSHQRVSYSQQNKAYIFNLDNGFEVWWSDENPKFKFAFILKTNELINQGLTLTKLPSDWEVLDQSRIIKYYPGGEINE